MRAPRPLSTRIAALGGALALAASGLVGAVGLGLVASAPPAGATTTQLGTSNCNLDVGGTPTPTPITPTATAVLSPSPVSAGSPFSFSTLSLGAVLDPAANPALVNVAGDTLSISFNSTLTATGATPATQSVNFQGNLVLPKPFNAPVTAALAGTTGSYTAATNGATSASILLSGTGSLVAAVVGTTLSFNGPCTGSSPTQIASVPVVPPAAYVTNVIPNAGTNAGGTTVKIVGQHLNNPLSVTFDYNGVHVPAASFQSISPNVIEAVTPPSPGANAPPNNQFVTQSTVQISVTTPAGPPTPSALESFTYVDPTLGAVVTGVSPQVGTSAGGNTVTITGSGFNDLPNGGPATDVFFGTTDVSLQPSNIISDSEIVVQAPPGTGVVNVTVVGNDGSTQSVTSAASRYNYAPGYMLTGSDGGVFSYGQTPGQANFFGSAGGIKLNQPIVGMALTPDGAGYWLVASDGGVFAYGDAYFYGSTGNITLNKPIVGIVPTTDGAGYWLVASDGGVFAYGDAPFKGSAAGSPLAAPVVGITANPVGSGYLLAAADGGVFAYGGAAFHGSLSGTALASAVSGIAATTDGGGYWLTTRTGAVFNEGDAGFYGDVAGIKLNGPIVGFAPVQATAPVAT